MAVCFTNEKDQLKFDVVVAEVGYDEAVRDYYEQNGEIRPPAVIKQKIADRLLGGKKKPLVEESSDDFSTEKIMDDLSKLIAVESSASALDTLATLSKALNIPYEIISSERADEMRGSQELVSGFYTGGKVYMVEGRITPGSVFHEFSHPLVKGLAINNLDLFNNLFNQLTLTPEGRSIIEAVKQNYPELDQTSLLFKEEAIVHAMEAYKNKPLETKGFWDNLLIALRKMLRAVFGVDASKLSTSTTLGELVQMLNKGTSISLPLSELSMDDAIMLRKEYEGMIQVIDEKAAKELQNIINSMHTLITKQLSATNKEGTPFEYMKYDGITTDDNKGLLQILNKLSESIATNSRKAVKGLEFLKEENNEDEIVIRLAAAMDIISKGSVMMDLFNDKFESLSTRSFEKPEDINDLFALSEFVDKWYLMIDSLTTDSFNYFDETAKDIISDIRLKASILKSRIDNQKFEGLLDIFVAFADSANSELYGFYDALLTDLKTKGNHVEYDKAHTEFYGLSVDELATYNELTHKKENSRLTMQESEQLQRLQYAKNSAVKIEKSELAYILSDLSYDVNGLNHFFESYANSQDKVIGTFYDIIRKNMNQVNARTLSQQGAFLNGFKDKLSKTKWNELRHLTEGAMGKAMADIDNVGKWNGDTRTMETRQVYKFKSNFKNWEADKLEKINRVDLARSEYNFNPTDDNYNAFVDAQIEYEDWQYNYMHQEFLPIVYDAQKLLRDEIGRKARKVLDTFYSEMNEMQDLIPLGSYDINVDQEIQDKWNDYRWLFSIYNPDGTLKTGEAFDIADRLQKYREAKQPFYETVVNEEAFQNAYNGYSDYLESNGYIKGTDRFKIAMDKWVELNTVVQVHDEYFETRKELLDERSELLRPLQEVNANIKDIAPLYEKIYNFVSLVKDSSGQADGSKHSAEIQKQVKELHEEIEKAKYELYSSSGLTKAEMVEYLELSDLIAADQHSSDELAKFNEYRERVKTGLMDPKFGLLQEEVDRIMEIDEYLNEMSVSVATDKYLSTFMTLIKNDPDSYTLFSKWYSSATGGSLEDGDVVTDLEVMDFLSSQTLIDILSINPSFQMWFENNHYKVESFDRHSEYGTLIIEKYMKTALWKYTSPKSLDSYKGFALTDAAGNVVDVLKLNGVPRVPSSKFSDRHVADEFKTKIIERDYVDENDNLVLATVDNRGNFLPRDLDQGAVSSEYINSDYKRMFHEERDAWNLLDYAKNFHLDIQKKVDAQKRLYLEYPVARKKGTERFQLKGLITRWFTSWVQAFGGRSADDFNYNLNMQLDSDQDSLDLDYYNRPVFGTFDLDINERSTDIVDLMMSYAHSVNTYSEMKRSYSLGRTVQDLLNKALIPSSVKKLQQENKFLALATKNKDISKRANHFNDLMDRYIKGIGIKGSKETTAGALRAAHSTVGKLGHMSSRKFFAFNWISDLTNPISGKIQFALFAQDAKTFFNYKNWSVGEAKSMKAMGQLLGRSYDSGTRPAQLQLMQLLDASPDLFDHSVGDAGSRTVLQDAVNFRVAYALRSSLQHQMNFTSMYALMDNSKFRFQINGAGPQVSLDKAVEVRNGKLYTKEGVPEEYKIGYDNDGNLILGSKIQSLMNTQKNFLMKTVGMAGRDLESEFANRRLIGKMALFIFRFLPGLIMDRYQFRIRKELNTAGHERGNLETVGAYFKALGTGKIQRRTNRSIQMAEFGMLINSFDAIRRILTGKVLSQGLQRNHIIGLTQTASMVLIEQIIQLLIGQIWFNDDDDDPENDFYFDKNQPGIYKKLSTVTALPDLPGVDQKFSAGMFDFGDFMKLQGLRLALRASRENATVYPWSAVSMGKDIALLNGPIAEGAFSDIATMGQIIFAMAQEGSLYPQGDNAIIGKDSGPYTWGRAGKHKLPNLIWRYYGLNGKMIDPAEAIKAEMKFTEIGGAR